MILCIATLYISSLTLHKAEGGIVYGQGRPDSLALGESGGEMIYDNQIADADEENEGNEPGNVGGETDDFSKQLYDIGGEGGQGLSRPLHFAPMAKPAAYLSGRRKSEMADADVGTAITVKALGSTVHVAGYGSGILKFVGPHHLSGDIYCGIALSELLGISDGVFEV